MLGGINNVVRYGINTYQFGNFFKASASDNVTDQFSHGGDWIGILERIPGVSSTVNLAKKFAIGVDAFFLQRGIYPSFTRSVLINNAALLGAVIGAAGTGALNYSELSWLGLAKKKKGKGSKGNKKVQKFGSNPVQQPEFKGERRFNVITGEKGKSLSSDEILLKILQHEHQDSFNLEDANLAELVERYYKENPEDPAANIMYGLVLLNDGKTSLSLSHLRNIERFDQAGVDEYLLLAHMEGANGNMNEAKRIVDRALDMFPGNLRIVEEKNEFERILQYNSNEFPKDIRDCMLLASQHRGTSRCIALLNYALQMAQRGRKHSDLLGDIYCILAMAYYEQKLYTWALNTFRLMEQHGGTKKYSSGYVLYMDLLCRAVGEFFNKSLQDSSQVSDEKAWKNHLSLAVEGERVTKKAIMYYRHKYDVIYPNLLTFLAFQGKTSELQAEYIKGKYYLELGGVGEEDVKVLLELCKLVPTLLRSDDK